MESVEALIDLSGCSLILTCYKELDRADMVREPMSLTTPYQISSGVPHSPHHGTGTQATV